MSWSVTVNDIPNFGGFALGTQEFMSGQHPAYARDAELALKLAKEAGLKSATLSGMRTDNPYGGDEIVDISVRGTPIYKDFLAEMSEIIRAGPGADSEMARHYAALAKMRANPCPHIFNDDRPPLRQCIVCGVILNGTLFYFEDVDEQA